MTVARRRHNPTRARRVSGALGLGISVTSLGLAFADIYRKPVVAYVAVAAGALLTAMHWPSKDHEHASTSDA